MMESALSWLKRHRFLIAGLVVVACVPLFLHDQYILQVMIMVIWFAYLTSSWNIVGGYAGQFSLGHAVFIGTGAYTSTMLSINLGLTPWIGMLAGGLAAVILAIIIGYPCFRLRAVYFALTSIVLCMLLQTLVTSTRYLGGWKLGAGEGLWFPVLGHAPGQFQFATKEYYYWTILGMLVVVALVSHLIRTSKIGYYLTGVKLDQEAADSLGVNVHRYKILSYCISAFFTALGGAFYAQLILYVAPDRLLSVGLSIEIVVMALLGGWGTVAGPILGAVLLVPISEVLRAQLGGQFLGLHLILYGIVLITAVLFLPKGIKEPLEKAVISGGRRLQARFQRLPTSSPKSGGGEGD